jgi:hypothetical protein
LVLITYPYYYFLTLLGIGVFLENKFRNIKLILFSIAITFIISLDISILPDHPIFNYSDFICNQPSSYFTFKLLHVYPFVLYGFYNFYNKEYLKGFTSILVVSIVYITLLVGVISSLGLFAIWMFFKDKKYSYLILIGTVLIGFIFYKISFETKVGDNAGKVAFLKNIKVSIIVFIEDTLKIIVFYFNVLFAAILYFFTKSEKFDLMDKLTLLFVSSAIFIALIFVSVFHGTSDFLQALFNLASPLFLVLFLYVVLKMNTFQTKIILSSSIVFLVIILYGNYNSDLKNLYNKNYTSEYKKQCIESINDNDKYLKTLLQN